MELDVDFLKIENTNTPQKGSLLVSEPYSEDNYFRRSIVLLTEHNQDGSMGFILNKPLKIPLNEVLNGFPSNFEGKISIGGPVETDTVFYIHTLGDILPHSVKIHDNLYWGGNFEHLKMMIEHQTIQSNQVRFFVGYAGWQPKQLDDEIKNNYWLVCNNLPKNLIATDKDELWREVVNSLGDKYKVWANFPENPLFN